VGQFPGDGPGRRTRMRIAAPMRRSGRAATLFPGTRLT
jgi:hypothetical protein